MGISRAAIDVLKDAIKEKPKEAAPYLQLAFIYAKYLKKTEQALKYANQAIVLDPLNFEAYQRLYEIEAGRGRAAKGARRAGPRRQREKRRSRFLGPAWKTLRHHRFQTGDGAETGRNQAGQRLLREGGRVRGGGFRRRSRRWRITTQRRSKSRKRSRFISKSSSSSRTI